MADSNFYKNVRGIFLTGYKISSPTLGRGTNYAGPIVFFLHTLLLPLTLTIGAGIKTLIDYRTRKPLPNDAISSLSKKVDELEDKEVNNICDAVLERDAKHTSASSISSSRLIEALWELKEQERNQGNRHLSEAQKRFLEDRKNEFKSDTIEITAAKLTPAAIETVKGQEEKTLQTISKSGTALKRDTLKRYIVSPDNNGKATHLFLNTKLNDVKSEEKLFPAPPIFVDDQFNVRVEVQIKRLRDNAAGWFGIGNNEKANRIQIAHNNFRLNKTADNMNELKSALDARRIGALTNVWDRNDSSGTHDSHTEAYRQVFQRGV